ncbi:MAG: hypothetical protein RBT68_12065 [Spirochaetia bacterium]|nr:hypothetical protein [Spirochaetia bacterium]
MDDNSFKRFAELRASFRDQVEVWSRSLPGLGEAQRSLAAETGETGYPVETPVVYNKALDDVGPDAHIRWLVVADNPGKNEQLAESNRYLVGRSGITAERFFARELGVDFRREVVIINKTPIHTPKTAQLRRLAAIYPEIRPVLENSQRFMAGLLAEMQKALEVPVWVMGISELGPRGIFAPWSAALKLAYAGVPASDRNRLYALKHFSMGAFATDMKNQILPGESQGQAALRIGAVLASRLWSQDE